MAENVSPSPAKRVWKPNFTPAECAVIFEKAKENVNVIYSKFSSTLTNKSKSRVWEEITNKANVLGVCERNVLDVKEKWRRMVSSNKKSTSVPSPAKRPTGANSRRGAFSRITMYGKAKLHSSETIVTLYRKTIPIIGLFNEHKFPPGPGMNRSKKC